MQYSAYLRHPFYHPKAVFHPRNPCSAALSTHLLLPGNFCSSVNISFPSFSNDFSDMHIVKYVHTHTIEAEVGVWIDLHKYKYSICTHI